MRNEIGSRSRPGFLQGRPLPDCSRSSGEHRLLGEALYEQLQHFNTDLGYLVWSTASLLSRLALALLRSHRSIGRIRRRRVFVDVRCIDIEGKLLEIIVPIAYPLKDHDPGSGIDRGISACQCEIDDFIDLRQNSRHSSRPPGFCRAKGNRKPFPILSACDRSVILIEAEHDRCRNNCIASSRVRRCAAGHHQCRQHHPDFLPRRCHHAFDRGGIAKYLSMAMTRAASIRDESALR